MVSNSATKAAPVAQPGPVAESSGPASRSRPLKFRINSAEMCRPEPLSTRTHGEKGARTRGWRSLLGDPRPGVDYEDPVLLARRAPWRSGGAPLRNCATQYRRCERGYPASGAARPVVPSQEVGPRDRPGRCLRLHRFAVQSHREVGRFPDARPSRSLRPSTVSYGAAPGTHCATSAATPPGHDGRPRPVRGPQQSPDFHERIVCCLRLAAELVNHAFGSQSGCCQMQHYLQLSLSVMHGSFRPVHVLDQPVHCLY